MEAPLTRTRVVLLQALAAALLLLAVLRPPEIYAWSGALVALLLAAAACPVWRTGNGAILPAWTSGLVPLALASIALAACRARAWDAAGEVLVLLLAACLGRAIASDSRERELLAAILAALGTLCAVLAVLQAHVIYREELAGLLAAPGSAPAYVLARLESGRPSGPFILPAALAGFFALTLPLSLFVARLAENRSRRALWGAAALLQIYALVLTRSVGGLVAAAASLFLALPILAPTRRILLAAVPFAAIVLIALFLYARRAEVAAPGGDPLVLRAGNWRAAGEMIRDHPLFGTGPGSFGAFYPRFMRPGMNETRYAHNSYLQALAEWGAWALLPLGCLVLAIGRRVRAAYRAATDDLPFCAAAAAFLVHNVVDFTAYLPGVALPAAILLGAGLAPARVVAPVRAASSPSRFGARVLGAVAAATFLVVFAGHAAVRAWTRALMEEARAAAAEGDESTALARARLAVRARPGDPAPRAFVAEWILAHGMNDDTLRREGRDQAERAVRLDPESAILHYDLSLYLRAARETGPAFREQRAAHILYPLKVDYLTPAAARRLAGQP